MPGAALAAGAAQTLPQRGRAKRQPARRPVRGGVRASYADPSPPLSSASTQGAPLAACLVTGRWLEDRAWSSGWGAGQAPTPATSAADWGLHWGPPGPGEVKEPQGAFDPQGTETSVTFPQSPPETESGKESHDVLNARPRAPTRANAHVGSLRKDKLRLYASPTLTQVLGLAVRLTAKFSKKWIFLG